jgi:hypothetical protein
MKNSLRDILACNSLKVNLYFAEIYHLHIQALLAAGFTLVSCLVFFSPKDGDDIFLRNISWLSVIYMVLHPRRQNYS